MYAEVRLTLDRRNKVLTIPVSAVDLGGNTAVAQVVVVTSDNHVEIRKIELGMETATKVEVKSGLKDGEMVVIGNRSGLLNGQEVRPRLTTMSPSAPA
jgi:multidrug efflux pump subunit AcrA (membrane-fusion protein)